MRVNWQNAVEQKSREFTCGHCGNVVASAMGWGCSSGTRWLFICPHCTEPTYFDEADGQFPDVAPGAEVGGLPEQVGKLYKEARNCVSASAYTGSVLCCRKLLMNIAVAEGAPVGKHFIEYVQFLSDSGYVPPKGKHWVDHIRNKGNEATHEIVEMKKADAEDLITFSEMLLKFIYEFPNRVPAPKPTT